MQDDDSNQEDALVVEPMLLTAKETAEALRCTPAQFDRLVSDGKLTPVRLFDDGEDMFAPAALADLVDTLAKPVTGTGRPARARDDVTSTPASDMNSLIRRRPSR